MSEQDNNELAEEIEKALLEAEEEARNDPTRLDHQTVMTNLRRAICQES
ncbi:hypothetical protein NLX71_15045 [Paenibacillus sp. MZ04-78.2]|nr:hypothetical protein [Paenibacillus sp. MZ04-78.2]MCP3774607.1 hypothetical protein [Paenibacillus sp. MZ04-78.2]